MNDSWDDVERLFGDAVALDPAARAVLLDARCVGRLERRREAESLLAAHDAAGAFLDVHPSAATAARETALDLTGATIGRYRLVERIGEGGMGVVYRGERADHEFVEEVAVKLLPLPMHGAEPLRRFRVERQALASLNHPDIVSLVDGGLTGGGQAFLAMRFVAGVPITEFCARHALGLDQRLGLFQRVCSAIQHAHRNGVVHCDLKPANILVTADGAPKILDFGVAKLLDARAARIDATATTAWRPLTPNYASPEQMRGLPVTTSCDVYALGIVLYELVAGTRPYDVTGLPLDAMLTTIVSRDARRPSAAASTGLPYPARHVKADLDAIVLKAISKEPARRYGSAQELADDIGRQLASQPVAAREPSLAYVVGTLARRHRASFIASSISIAALVTALGVSLWQTRTATIERNRATTRFNDLRQLANALIFKIHDGVQPLPGSTPVRQTVVAEALRYLERLTADPSADDSLRLDIAKGYLRLGTIQGLPDVPNLGDRESAFRSLQNAITLLEPLTAGTAAAEAALTMDDALVAFSRVAGALGKRDQSLTAIRRTTHIAELLRQRRPDDDPSQRLLASSRCSPSSPTASGASATSRWSRRISAVNIITGTLSFTEPAGPPPIFISTVHDRLTRGRIQLVYSLCFDGRALQPSFLR